MNAEFQWWLLILGIVIGGALVYLVLADLHDDRDDEEDELEVELEEEVPADVSADDWPVAGEPAADERGPGSVGDDPGVQRDGAKRETPVADLP